jgi:hypothetical protein
MLESDNINSKKMKKIKLNQKLVLNKETVAQLNNAQMRQVNGGGFLSIGKCEPRDQQDTRESVCICEFSTPIATCAPPPTTSPSEVVC